MVGAESGKDWTEAMVGFNSIKLATLTNISGFVLKSRSPSCGPGNVPLHHGQSEEKKFNGGIVRARFNAVLSLSPRYR